MAAAVRRSIVPRNSHQGGRHGPIIAPARARQERHQCLGHRPRLHVVFRRLRRRRRRRQHRADPRGDRPRRHLLNSSDAYGKGHNETLLGQALKGRRAGVVLATKFGNLGGAGGKFADGRPEFVISSCEASLKRLGVDVIDLYYQHRIDPAVPIEDTVGAMAKLVQQGKVRALGLSEASPETIRRAHKVHPIAAVQNEYSLLYREQADDTRQTTRELGISFVAYAPLGRGLLTADIADPATLADGDTRKRQPRYSGDNLAHNRALAQKVEAIAKRKGCTPAQLALAWVLAQGAGRDPDPRHQAEEAAAGKHRRAQRASFRTATSRKFRTRCRPAPPRARAIRKAQMASLYI